MAGAGAGAPRADREDGGGPPRKGTRPRARFRPGGGAEGRRRGRRVRRGREGTRLPPGREERPVGRIQRPARIDGLPAPPAAASGDRQRRGHGPRRRGELRNLPGLRPAGLRGRGRGREGEHRSGLVRGRPDGDLRVRRGGHDALQPAEAAGRRVRAPRSRSVQDHRGRRQGRRRRLVRDGFQREHPAGPQRGQRSLERPPLLVPGGRRPRQGPRGGRGPAEHAGRPQDLQAGIHPAEPPAHGLRRRRRRPRPFPVGAEGRYREREGRRDEGRRFPAGLELPRCSGGLRNPLRILLGHQAAGRGHDPGPVSQLQVLRFAVCHLRGQLREGGPGLQADGGRRRTAPGSPERRRRAAHGGTPEQEAAQGPADQPEGRRTSGRGRPGGSRVPQQKDPGLDERGGVNPIQKPRTDGKSRSLKQDGWPADDDSGDLFPLSPNFEPCDRK
mmetsp:Transcript_21172/g.50247  ORF Transcript_21172/g.50247 Transcript_21172/m.50247 type:complete len:444 (+) Transcript_21172:371-1702(+)